MTFFGWQIYAVLLAVVSRKYFYMSRTQRHIKKQSNITNEESYAILQKPTNATFISTQTMEINEEEKSVRQKSKIVYAESGLA